MPLNPPTHHHHHCFKLDSEYLTLLEETNYFANAASLLTDTFLETQVSLAPTQTHGTSLCMAHLCEWQILAMHSYDLCIFANCALLQECES